MLNRGEIEGWDSGGPVAAAAAAKSLQSCQVTMKCRYTPIRMVKIKNTDKIERGCRVIRSLIGYWWECKMVWKRV